MDGALASSAGIRQEADELLHNRRLLALLARYGTPCVHGSYALDLMTWRDLDVYLEADAMDEQCFFQLGGELAAALLPFRMSYRNECLARTANLPHGLYWGIYLHNDRDLAWKVDLWCVSGGEFRRLQEPEEMLARRLTAETRLAILRIKQIVCQHPEYRRSVTSQDVYAAVLDGGAATVDEFWRFIQSQGR